ncbi:hypothetical protein V3M63_06640 [Trueperella pyogenes]|uniref:hypothetical protein n=1 Tax=Trueperella pyogenes TaxID=1661 RepID=UPI00345DC8FE
MTPPLLEQAKTICNSLNLPFQTGIYTDAPHPDTFVVATPLADVFDMHADNQPGIEIESARLSLFTKSNYLALRNRLTKALITGGVTVVARRYMGFEDDTGYHHYALDIETHHIFDLEGNP